MGNSNAVVNQPADDTVASSAKALTDPSGPDITVDQARLQASVRVLANLPATAAEVQEGCAGGLTGRTLIRFDVRTPNNGPGDLQFGPRSTMTICPAVHDRCPASSPSS